MSVSIKPLEDRVVVKPLEAEQTTASGLVIPDTAKEKPQEGEVVAVGAGRFDDKGERIPVDVKVGDEVVFSKYGGTELKYGDDEYLVLGSRDILAIIEACPRWLKRSSTTRTHVARSSAVSTSSRTPSRSPSAPRAATSSWTRSGVAPPSPTTA